MKFLATAAAVGAAFWVTEMILDRWVIRSDTGDPQGFIVQAEGFGLDDIVRILATGAAGAWAVGFVRKVA